MSYCRAPVSRPGPPLRSGWLRVGLARGRTADAEAGGPGGGRGAGRWRAGHRSGSAPRHAQGCAARTSRTATAVWQAARAVGWARRASVAGTTRAGRQEAHARAGRSTGAGWRAAWGQRAPHPSQVAALHCWTHGLLLPGYVLLTQEPWKAPHGRGVSRRHRGWGAALGPLPWPAAGRCGSSCLKATQCTLRSLLRQGQAPSAPPSLQSCCAPLRSLDTRSLRVGFAA